MYPSSITESCDNSVKQVIVASGSVSLLVDIMFCDDKRLERRRAYRKIAKVSRPGLIFFKGPFSGPFFWEGLIYGGKFVFQNRLG